MEPLIFRSRDFPLVPHEDEGLNPGILGKSLSRWIVRTLEGTRFAITEEIEEDFGYCLMVHRRPYWLWVGCVGTPGRDYPEGGLTETIAAGFPLESIEWRVWVEAEWGLASRALGRDEREKDMGELHALLRERLAAECDVSFDRVP